MFVWNLIWQDVGGELLWQLRKSRETLGIERRGANYESNTGIGFWRTGGHFSCEWRLRRPAGNETWRKSCRSLTGWPRGVWFWLRDWQWHRRKSPRGEIQGHRWKTLQNKHKQHYSDSDTLNSKQTKCSVGFWVLSSLKAFFQTFKALTIVVNFHSYQTGQI